MKRCPAPSGTESPPELTHRRAQQVRRRSSDRPSPSRASHCASARRLAEFRDRCGTPASAGCQQNRREPRIRAGASRGRTARPCRASRGSSAFRVAAGSGPGVTLRGLVHARRDRSTRAICRSVLSAAASAGVSAGSARAAAGSSTTKQVPHSGSDVVPR